jgi:hypothetical protein
MRELLMLAKDFSVSMALVDYIPVIFFGSAIVILIRSLGSKMNKAQFSLFSAGSINVFAAGFLKATYKLLYAANICDFQALNNMFFPVQSIGFLLAGAGMIWFVIEKFAPKNRLNSVAPGLFSGTFLFVGLMCTGLLLLDVALCVICKKLKKSWVMVLFILSFVCSLGMGYLSSQDFEKAAMNWIAECVNIVGQGTLLAGVLVLRKSGLEELEC